MELRRLRYFVAVAEELHFRRAAERLHLAQPALSAQVRKLERELGVELLHRTKRDVALTAAGALFLDEARRRLRQADEAARTARNARTGAAGRIRLRHLPDAVPSILLRAIASFAARYPAIEIVPETCSTRRAVEDVRAGRLDVAVIGLPAPAQEMQVTPFAVERTIAAVPDRHILSGRAAIAIDALAETPLVLLPRAVNPAFYDAIITGCRAANISPQIVEATEPQVEHTLLLVASGLGIALLPSSVENRYDTVGVSFRPVASPAPTIELALVARLEPVETSVVRFTRIMRELDSPARETAAAITALNRPAALPLSA